MKGSNGCGLSCKERLRNVSSNNVNLPEVTGQLRHLPFTSKKALYALTGAEVSIGSVVLVVLVNVMLVPLANVMIVSSLRPSRSCSSSLVVKTRPTSWTTRKNSSQARKERLLYVSKNVLSICSFIILVTCSGLTPRSA